MTGACNSHRNPLPHLATIVFIFSEARPTRVIPSIGRRDERDSRGGVEARRRFARVPRSMLGMLFM